MIRPRSATSTRTLNGYNNNNDDASIGEQHQLQQQQQKRKENLFQELLSALK
jgi:hypothetical protein